MSPPSSSNATLLNLSTLIERPVITIDGRRHEIMSPEELPILTSQRLTVRGKRMEILSKQEVLNADEESELTNILHELSNIIMEPVAPEVRAKLTDPMRTAVIEVFTMLLLTNRTGKAAAMVAGLTQAGASQTGGKTFRGSNASSAVPPKAGSKKPRSRS